MNIKTIIATGMLAVSATAFAQNGQQEMKFQEEQLNLTMEWDKTFPQSDKVKHSKIIHRRTEIFRIDVRRSYAARLSTALTSKRWVKGNGQETTLCQCLGI